MSEPETLTPRQAVDEISRLQGFDAALRRRTAGLTWMIWGFAVPGIFLSYVLAGNRLGDDFPLWAYFLWVPWGLLGGVASATAWRSAALAIRIDERHLRRRIALTGLVILATLYAVFGLAHLLHQVGIHAGAAPLAGLGLACLIVGATGLRSSDRLGRDAWMLAGAILLLAGVAFTLAAVPLDDAQAEDLYAILTPVSAAAAFFASGFYLSTRG